MVLITGEIAINGIKEIIFNMRIKIENTYAYKYVINFLLSNISSPLNSLI